MTKHDNTSGAGAALVAGLALLGITFLWYANTRDAGTETPSTSEIACPKGQSAASDRDIELAEADHGQSPRASLSMPVKVDAPESNQPPADKAGQFDLRRDRLARIERLRKKFEDCRRGTEDEWDAGFALMQLCVAVHKDFVNDYTEANGEQVRRSTATEFEFRLARDGRHYSWKPSEYPLLSEIAAFKFKTVGMGPASERHEGVANQQVVREKPSLSADDRGTVLGLWAQAVAELGG